MQEDGLVPPGKRNGGTLYLVTENVVPIARLREDPGVAGDRPRVSPPMEDRLDVRCFSLEANVDRIPAATEHLDHRGSHQHVAHAPAQVHENILVHIVFAFPAKNPRAGTLRTVFGCTRPSAAFHVRPAVKSAPLSQLNLMVSAVGFTTRISRVWRRLRLATRSRGSLAIGHGTWSAAATASALAPSREGASPKSRSTSA